LPLAHTGQRFTALEEAMADLARAQVRTEEAHARTEEAHARTEEAHVRTEEAQARTTANLDRLSAEMREFKDEMRVFRDENRVFRDESRDREKRSEREQREFRKQLGEISRKMGTMAEDIVLPGIKEVFRQAFGHEGEIEVYGRASRTDARKPGRMREFDAVAHGGGVLLITETKSKARPEDVATHLAAMAEVRFFFPEWASDRLVGALASFTVDDDVVKHAQRFGLLVFGLGEGLLQILNDPGFTPKSF
jgi:predicted RNase H-like nuclease (RuvC/YqgF family)